MPNLSVLAFVICRGGTDRRLDGFVKCVKDAKKTAGIKFDLVVHGLGEGVKERFEKDLKGLGRIKLVDWGENVGQHVVMNKMIEMADKEGYEYLLRFDDDIKWLTKRWLHKMVRASEELGSNFILSPTILGLNHPPEGNAEINVNGVDLKILNHAIGGGCRLHVVDTLLGEEGERYISDVRSPLGMGDATGIGQWCKILTACGKHRWMAWLSGVRVKHSTTKMTNEDADYYKGHMVFQHIPYIPPFKQGGGEA